MRRIYLAGLRLYDSKDAEFPLEYEQVTNLKKEIFLEFLRFNADEHIAIDLFGDLALPDQIIQILSLVPHSLKICQGEDFLYHLNLPNIQLVQERPNIEYSSNPVFIEKPVFILSEDDKFQIIESSAKGVVPRSIESPENLSDGIVGYLPDFVTFSESEKARLFGNKVAFVCRDPQDSFERRMSEKMPQKVLCFLIHLIEFCEG